MHLLEYLHPEKYTEHELASFDGIEGFRGFLGILPKGAKQQKVVRAIQDGDFVFTHTEYHFFGPQVAFDVFRFKDGLIAEHWDNVQDYAAPNPSGRTMTDGETEIKDRDRTEANKALVRNFVEEILIGGKTDRLAAYFEGEAYLQHNPHVADGVSTLKTALSAWAALGTIQYHAIHKVLGEGNFVLVLSEGRLEGKHTAFYDLFRIENGKLAEHWDTIQQIPPREDWKNDNGKF